MLQIIAFPLIVLSLSLRVSTTGVKYRKTNMMDYDYEGECVVARLMLRNNY